MLCALSYENIFFRRNLNSFSFRASESITRKFLKYKQISSVHGKNVQHMNQRNVEQTNKRRRYRIKACSRKANQKEFPFYVPSSSLSHSLSRLILFIFLSRIFFSFVYLKIWQASWANIRLHGRRSGWLLFPLLFPKSTHEQSFTSVIEIMRGWKSPR